VRKPVSDLNLQIEAFAFSIGSRHGCIAATFARPDRPLTKATITKINQVAQTSVCDPAHPFTD
jgi:hypothetical protein